MVLEVQKEAPASPKAKAKTLKAKKAVMKGIHGHKTRKTMTVLQGIILRADSIIDFWSYTHRSSA